MDQCGYHPSSAEEWINVTEVELKPLTCLDAKTFWILTL